jgi:hypothetical protein
LRYAGPQMVPDQVFCEWLRWTIHAYRHYRLSIEKRPVQIVLMPSAPLYEKNSFHRMPEVKWTRL